MSKAAPNNRRGFTKYTWKTDEEREYILRLIDKGYTDKEISKKVGWPMQDVGEVRVQFFPTCGLATYYIRSQAMKLAERVVAEGNVVETIDILSRPNINVLAPAVKNQPGPMKASFLTSIKPEDLGGVKVAAMVQMGESSTPSLPEVQAEPELKVPCSVLERVPEGRAVPAGRRKKGSEVNASPTGDPVSGQDQS